MVNPDKNSIKKVVGALIKNLSDRNKDIVLRRFGLKTGEKETLESIGQSYGVTRERIRQIEEHALKNLCAEINGAMTAQTKPYFDFVSSVLNEHGGFLSEKSLFEKFSANSKENLINLSLAFLLSLNSSFKRVCENENFHTLWSLNKGASDSPVVIIDFMVSAIKSRGALLSKEELYDIYAAKTKEPISLSAFLTAITVSKNVDCNIFGQYGLADWPEIKPRGVKDRAYMILKREAEPKHFREISNLINTAQFLPKKANIQTVHNELIKDSRFVLVGRGIYGLSEWGYKAGTVKDVLVDILKEARRPLSKDELVAKVLSSRLVKENTIILNLQNPKIFRKKDDGKYALC